MTKSNGDIKKAAADITASASTPEEKLKKLYEFCQTQIKNTTFDASLTDEDRQKLPAFKSIADVLKRKSGGVMEIDMLFGAMASSLGLETRIAHLSNRSEMFFTPQMTNEYFVRPGAIAVLVGNEWKFFNAGSNFLPYGMLPWSEEDVWALLVGEKAIEWVKTPFSGYEKSVAKRTGKFKLSEDGTLEGDVRIEFAGQTGLLFTLLRCACRIMHSEPESVFFSSPDFSSMEKAPFSPVRPANTTFIFNIHGLKWTKLKFNCRRILN
jgi:hypothetical protein